MNHTEKKKSGDNFYRLLGEGRKKSSKKQKQKQTIDSTNSLCLSTTSSFYYSDKKSDSYLTLIQMLKSDLLQIQDMINSNTQDIKMFKLLSKAPGLSKKLSEIEEQKSISHLLDKITEDSQKYEKISKIYNCNDYKKLVQKIFLELSFNELLLKKIYDFFVLMKLSLHKDDTYQESLSKIISIKSFIEKTISKINDKNKNRNINNNNDNNILKIESLQELLNLDKKNDKNTTDIIKHIIKLINKYFKNENETIIAKINDENNKDDYKINVEQLENKSEILKFEQINNELINIIYKLKTSYNEEKEKNEKLINEISEKDKQIETMNNNQNSDIDNLKAELENEKKKILEEMEELNKKYEDKEKEYDLLREENNRLIQEISQYKENEQNSSEKNIKFEDDLKVKDEKILDLEKINTELNNKINELNKKINELNNKITELEKKKNNNIDINKVMKDSDIIKMVNNYDAQLKKLGNDLMNKNKDELRNLENKLKNLESKYEMIVLERESLKKNIIYLKGKKYDPDSYEEVLKEQFETMRNAFTQKIDDLNEELNDVKRDSRVRIYNLELELKENVRLKNNFLKQIISLQSQLDALNQ